MNGNRPMELHYIDNGFPYANAETFMDFFHTHVPLNYFHADPVYDQDNLYWSMNANAYKFGFSGQEMTSSYYGAYEISDQISRMDINRTTWEYHPALHIEEEPITAAPEAVGDSQAAMDVHLVPEGCIPNQHSSNSSQVAWQDNIDPDNMTYEELLELGEAVGTQSRGLSQDFIDSLPTTKYKFGSIFSRKKSGERCVICQLKYRIGDKQTKLPCKHAYHSECISKWLGINKICPICNVEVFGEEAKQ